MATLALAAAACRPGETVRIAEIPLVDVAAFSQTVLDAVEGGSRIAALFGRPLDQSGVRLYAVLTTDEAGIWSVVSADIGDEYPSLTPDCPQAHWFEREI